MIERHDPERDLHSLLQRLLALHEEEAALLRRIESILRPSPEETGEAGSTERSGRPDVGGGPGTRAWVDQVVESALARAFSGGLDEDDEDDDDHELDEEEARRNRSDQAAARNQTGPEDAAEAQLGEDRAQEILLLLVGDGRGWAGLPWALVTRVGLDEEEEAEQGSVGDLSGGDAERRLRSLGGLLRGSAATGAAEPYRVCWETPAGPVAISCAELGEVVNATVAGERGIEAVVTSGDDGEPMAVPLVEFLIRPELFEPALPRGARAAARQSVPSEAPEPEAAGKTGEPAGEDRSSSISAAMEKASQAKPGAPGSEAIEAPAGSEEQLAQPQSPPEEEHMARRPESSGPAGSAGRTRGILLAVHHLPARVTIGRALRSRSWNVIEAVDAREIVPKLRSASYSAVFVEAPEPPVPGLLPLLQSVLESGCPVVAVGSRMRGAADPLRQLGDIPRLAYPPLFSDLEVERIVESLNWLPAHP